MDLLHRKVIPLCQGKTPAILPSSRYHPRTNEETNPTRVGTNRTIEEIEQFLGGDRGLSTEERKKTSEESNKTSEESNETSEEFVRTSLDNPQSPPRRLSNSLIEA